MADADSSTVTSNIQDHYSLVSNKLDAAKAICDAVAILCALERAPEHQDTHPSHNIRTGNGYAHGHRVYSETLPVLLRHVVYLIDDADNESDCMREVALNCIADLSVGNSGVKKMEEGNHVKH